MKKLKVSKIVALAGIAAVLFGFASCDTNADDSSNLAAAVLLDQKSGGTAGTTTPSTRLFATGATTTRTKGSAKWASVFVAQPTSVGCICKEIISAFAVVSTGSTTAGLCCSNCAGIWKGRGAPCRTKVRYRP